MTKQRIGDAKAIAALKHELTATPINLMMASYAPSSNASSSSIQIPCYLESGSKLYLPKAFGLAKFGIPSEIKLSPGADIHIPFVGQLRQETQQGPCDAFLEAAADPKRMGGIINLSCGVGKTVCALYVISQFAKKTIIVAHKEFLMNQWAERIQQFLPSARIGFIKGKVCDVVDKDIVIASLQSLVVGEGADKYASLKQIITDDRQSFGMMVGDETHHLAASVFKRVFLAIPTRVTLGLSATLDRKDGLTKVLYWYMGQVVNRPPASSSSSTSMPVKVQVKVFSFYASDLAYSREEKLYMGGEQKVNISRMINNICAYHPRTQFIARLAVDVLSKDPERRILILSDRRQHLEDLRSCLTLASSSVDSSIDSSSIGMVVGGIKKETLKANEVNCRILLGTFAYVSEGFDVQTLNTLILASPKSDVIQVCGRILRCPDAERQLSPLILDVVDKFSVFENQAKKRNAYYRSQRFLIEKIAY